MSQRSECWWSGIEGGHGAARIRAGHRSGFCPRRSGNTSWLREDTPTTCERSTDRACPIESPWSRDHEDGGPTIQLPAAEDRCTLLFSELRSVYADVRRHSNGADVEFAV